MAVDDMVKKITSSLDYGYVSSKIEHFLLENLEGSGKAGYVLGLSGGLDSSVVAVLAARALYGRGKGKGSLTALIIPHSSITPSSDVNDAIRLAESINIAYRVIDIGDIHSSLAERLHTIDGGGENYSSVDNIKSRIASGNLLARLRMCTLYYYANANDCLVLGTSDRSELMIGYYTKYGDGAADILPIADLYKVQVRALASYLQIDDAIIRKKSGPMLWKGHYAEQELGMSYEEIDSILYCLIDLKSSVKDTASMLGIEEERVKSVIRLVRSSRHKRAPPRICHIQ
ncbi:MULTISPECIES: NAD+ synthase [Candidatus Nitrosocaldus]|jgi:NAD+ synthase|uniref:NH(3)-dependent NAD(+) synthetase n=1 Tax=Candidatus Nitrosocaldus cavascurensis TaxID=2058097 RepID=A0A2K5ASS9_9ARCH|nr:MULTISPECIES: NAD+ synthase [Candidatus Nitrosocaldus]SPC34691.1 NH(3)-dependent NAD(+) synthetase [Candidatus Nitrosocaldus cavascurensis]